jgi:hypothetical protein
MFEIVLWSLGLGNREWTLVFQVTSRKRETPTPSASSLYWYDE